MNVLNSSLTVHQFKFKACNSLCSSQTAQIQAVHQIKGDGNGAFTSGSIIGSFKINSNNSNNNNNSRSNKSSVQPLHRSSSLTLVVRLSEKVGRKEKKTTSNSSFSSSRGDSSYSSSSYGNKSSSYGSNDGDYRVSGNGNYNGDSSRDYKSSSNTNDGYNKFPSSSSSSYGI
ncbi:hypothetical protein ACTA71_009405 [Dictyostelium dimigraforme]